uniref:Conopeptide Y-Fe1 n=1 Tax=Conus ferrugineus TaxID=379542 RepID=CPY1_CONFR|nr:RecName: Full=Conopeptide Y-Fe1; AltName: Full=CPY-Fe1; Flags: Precursor [Conus ferrugineus]ABV74050.1 CPY-Fe1 precursor [Conus ferrugineus]
MSKLGVVLFVFLLLLPLAAPQPVGDQPADQPADRNAEARGTYLYPFSYYRLWRYFTRFLHKQPYYYVHI